jgi:ABC-type polysaccharide/polyol phosphate transport system ATPase subunit
MKEIIVKVEQVSFSYVVKHALAPSLKQVFINSFKGVHSDIKIDASKNLNFELRSGEVLGIIGKNGSGKSTLLKLLAGILTPNSGRITVKGKTAPLIELGAGFNLELTGLENIILFGVLLGNKKKEMEIKANGIAEWAGLTEYINLPIRTYSTGMLARLGFAVATAHPSALLIIDEVLSVGDSEFQVKSLHRVNELISEGEATILVSHDLQLIEERATKVLWLDHGNQMMLGNPEEVINAYRKY